LTGAPWAAEVAVDEELAARLIGEQFPSLAALPVCKLGEGWDNAAFLVGARYVFRFPRRAVAVTLIETEMRVLPEIVRRVPLRVPEPHFRGVPSDKFGWPFCGYERLGGTPLSGAHLDDPAYRKAARDVGAFLRALHAIDAWVGGGLDGDRIGRLDHTRCAPKAVQRLHELQAAGVLREAVALEALLERFAPAQPRSERWTTVHGDLYTRHVLVDDAGRATGVIDWGDVHCGDPAVDIAVAFESFPPASRDAFLAGYGAVDETTWDWARYRALYHSALVAHYGFCIGDAELLNAGLAGLSFCRV